MSDKLGPLAYGQKDEEIFLGRQITRHKDYSEETAITIDDEIKKIVMNGLKRAEKILSENQEVLLRLAATLLEREILDSSEIDAVIRGEQLPPLEGRSNGKDAVAGAAAPLTDGAAPKR
jgi:cell division protease FtsH